MRQVVAYEITIIEKAPPEYHLNSVTQFQKFGMPLSYIKFLISFTFRPTYYIMILSQDAQPKPRCGFPNMLLAFRPKQCRADL